MSEDPALMVPGQVLPTITKSILREASLADVPGNGNCTRLTLSYHGEEVKLTDSMDENELTRIFYNSKPQQSSMKNLIAKLNAQKFQGISLADTATEADVMLALDAVLGKNTTLTELTTTQAAEITRLTGEKQTLETEVANEKKATQDSKAVMLVEGAVAAKKITAAQKDGYVKLAKADFDSTKAILDGMTGFKSISGQIDESSDDNDDVKLAAEYDKLHKSGKLVALKASNPDKYKQLYKARYGNEPKG
jgi:hypothetical protein